ncbi:MAG: hypothetical protein PHR77_17575 [Kiritimatiellae bacterium]|nr:hypothetical protein [Kiritimatiellia bacterium]MDD5520104.1 hypothetical protein [Kiritimatiellia bacterium]
MVVIRYRNILKTINGWAVAVCFLIPLLTGGITAKDAQAISKLRVEDMSKGSIQVTVIVDPQVIRIDKDVILTVKISAPSEIEVTMPAMEDRLRGFIQNGMLDKEPVNHSGKITYERQLLLTPVISDEYRLAPFPIVYVDKGKSPAATGWFASKPIIFDTAPIIDGKANKDINVSMQPIWIYPPFKTVALYFLLFTAGIAGLFLIWKLLKKVRRQIQLMRMSPKERALEELAELLAKNLVEKSLVKEFYLELTMIVRRYIERAHSIRAPEQTTEEFLAAVTNDVRFSHEVITRLKSFLEAADLVKFAAYHPETNAITRATDTARGYVETDAADQDLRNNDQQRDNDKKRDK